MAGMLQNLDPKFLCLCEEMCLWVWQNLVWDQFTELDPEYTEICRNGNNPVALTELWSKFLWSIFSLLYCSSPCKIKITLVPRHASNPIKTCRFNLIEQFWEHKSIYLRLSHPPKVGTRLTTLKSALQSNNSRYSSKIPHFSSIIIHMYSIKHSCLHLIKEVNSQVTHKWSLSSNKPAGNSKQEPQFWFRKAILPEKKLMQIMTFFF